MINMIKISEKSYLYRLALYGSKFEKHKIPTNLCPFMRHVCYGIGWCILLVIIGVIIVGVLLAPITMLVISLYTGYAYIITDAVLVGIVFYCMIAMLFLMLGLVVIKDETNVFETIYEKADNITSIHVVILWLKALHEKMCPQIGFKK